MSDEKLVEELVEALNNRKNRKSKTEKRTAGHGKVFVLFYLCKHDGRAFPGELCQEMGITTPRVTAILNDLEQEGLINRSIVADDRRKICVSITEQGTNWLKEKQKQQEVRVRHLIETIGEEDAKVLLRILKKIENM